MDVLKELEKLQAQAEASSDGKSVSQIETIIEQLRPVTQNEVIAIVDAKIKEALG